jgi:hypothetical protein
VGHLVEDRLGAAFAGRVGDLRAKEVVLVEGDAAHVLHRARVELGDEDLVVLAAERIRVVERLLEEVEALLGDFEDLVRLEIRRERLPAVQAEIQVPVLRPRDVIRAGHDRRDIGRHGRRSGERPLPGFALGRPGNRLNVGDDLPPGRRHDREVEPALEIGLVETRVDPVDVERLGIGVRVDEPVDGVAEPMHPDAGVLELAGRRDAKLILGRQPLEADPRAVEGLDRHLRTI